MIKTTLGFKSSTIQTVLDISMFILIIFASYCLVFNLSQYWYFIVAIMFGFLYYFISYRLPVFINSYKYKPVIHEIKSSKISPFLVDFQRKNFDKSRYQLEMMKNGDPRKDQSIHSYLNRSRKAIDFGQSRINLAERNNNQKGDFSFLEGNNNQKLIRDSFVRQNRGMKDTYIRHVTSHQQRNQNKNRTLQKIRDERHKNYKQTLRKLKISKQQLQQLYYQIKKLCQQFVNDFYQQSINNLRQVIITLQQIYQIKISCRDFPELQGPSSFSRSGYSIYPSQDYRLQIGLQQIINMFMKNKGQQLNLPIRKNKNQEIMNKLKQTQYFFSRSFQPSLQTSQIPESARSKLKNLAAEQQKLLTYFNNENNSSVNAQKLLQNLKMLKECQDEQFYEFQNQQYDRVTEDLSQKLLLIFNVCRNKLNDIIGQPNLALQYRRKSFLGWLTTQPCQYEIKQTINADYGHPHYDLVVNNSKNPNLTPEERKDPSMCAKEEYCCVFGPENGFSLLFMYLSALRDHEHGDNSILGKNNRILEIISRCC